MTNRLIDPLAIINTRLAEVAALQPVDHVFEMRLTPPPGARVSRCTVASTYRQPIPILYDFETRTAYPVPNEG